MFMPEPNQESPMTATAKLNPRLDHPDQLLGELQEALAALADIEFRYEIIRERLGACDGSDTCRKSLVDLEARREQERALLIDKVQKLQRKMFGQLG